MSRQPDSAYNERKLKPIYDYLDNGHYKRSLQEIDKLLKKAKDWQYLKVLKSLTLIRMSRQKDGVEILSDVTNENPVDDSTLQTMTICYRELQQNEMIASIYENALKKDPTSEKLFTHLFMAYVRLQDYKKQQLTALNLYKVHPKNPYYFWAVMSIYMQAITASDENMATKITLPLAEKMCQKFYNDNKFETEQELELYLMILEKQKKYKEMIELIDTSVGAGQLHDPLGFVKHRKVQLLKRENRLKEAFENLVDLIRRNCDQFEYYNELFQLAGELDAEKDDSDFTFQFLALVDEMCNRTQGSNWVSSSSEENTTTTTETNPESNNTTPSSKGKCRGPAMAKITISRLIQQRAKEQGANSSNNKLDYSKVVNKIEALQNDNYIVDLIYEYFLQFGSKYVCIKDIFFMLQQTELGREQIEQLLLKMKLSLMNLDQEKSMDEINRSICYHHLVHYNSDASTKLADKQPQVAALLELHTRSLQLAQEQNVNNNKENETNDKSKENATNSNKQNSQPFDPVVYLLANQLSASVDIYHDSCLPPNGATLDLVVLLESALVRNSYDFYSKLLLVRLYNSLGAASSSHALYETLDIKLIQNDTLGHFFLPAFLSTGLFSHAQQFLNASWKFYSYNFKEAADFIINLYKYGSFNKIEEIISFNYKLRNSLQYHLTFIEKLYLALLIDCKNHLSFSNLANDCLNHLLSGNFEVDWDKICDNRDLTLLSSNHQQLQSHILETLKGKTCTDEILWLRYRFALLHALTIASHLSESLFSDSDKSLMDNGDTNKKPLTEADQQKLSLDTLAKMVEQLAELQTVTKSTVEKGSLKYCLEGPSPSRLNAFFKNRQSQCIQALLNYLLGIFKYCSKSDQEVCTLQLDVNNVFAELVKEIEMVQAGQLSIFTIRQALENVTNLIETLSVCISLLDVAYNTVQKFTKASKKSKKKKSADATQFKDSEQVIGSINENLSSFRARLEELLKPLQSFVDKSVGNVQIEVQLQFTANLENISSLESVVKDKLKLSYEKSFSELAAIVQAKSKYLTSLGISNQ